jgi:hypothetical protein
MPQYSLSSLAITETVPVVILSTCKWLEMEQIILLDVYLLTIAFTLLKAIVGNEIVTPTPQWAGPCGKSCLGRNDELFLTGTYSYFEV